jgi:hypothetical protein
LEGWDGMMRRVSEPVPDWWDDELDGLVKRCADVFGEDETDDTVVHVMDHYCRDIDSDDVPVRAVFVSVLVEALKAEFRRRLTPH